MKKPLSAIPHVNIELGYGSIIVCNSDPHLNLHTSFTPESAREFAKELLEGADFVEKQLSDSAVTI
ncbi:MAG: hypothetical protein ACAH12_03460 [Methylophilaceae bacterium]